MRVLGGLENAALPLPSPPSLEDVRFGDVRFERRDAQSGTAKVQRLNVNYGTNGL